MQLRTPIIERAYALARSGSCQNVNEVRQRLKAEGYLQVSDYLEGKTLLGNLKRLCEAHYVERDDGEDVDNVSPVSLVLGSSPNIASRQAR